MATSALPKEKTISPSDLPKDTPLCGSKKRQGAGTCRREAGWGTEHPGTGHCKHHGGASPSGQLHAARQEIAIMGREVDISPGEGLLLCVRIAAGEVGYCTQRIADLTAGEEYEELEFEKTTRFINKDGDESGGIDETQVKEKQLNIWIRVRQAGLDRLAKFSKMALDAGVAERQVRIAEQQGALIAEILKGVLLDLGIDLEASKTRQVVRRHLMAVNPENTLTQGVP